MPITELSPEVTGAVKLLEHAKLFPQRGPDGFWVIWAANTNGATTQRETRYNDQQLILLAKSTSVYLEAKRG